MNGVRQLAIWTIYLVFDLSSDCTSGVVVVDFEKMSAMELIGDAIRQSKQALMKFC
jgi:hypothetical protein